MGNIKIANFSQGEKLAKVAGLYQYDFGQILEIQGLDLPTAVEIHFAFENQQTAVTRIGNTVDKVTRVAIPDTCLEYEGLLPNQTGTFYAYIYISDETSGQTEYKIALRIAGRAKPQAYDKPEDADLFREAIDTMKKTAQQAEAWAHGVESLPDSATDNAEYYAEQSKANSEIAIQKVSELKETLDNFGKPITIQKSDIEQGYYDATTAEKKISTARIRVKSFNLNIGDKIVVDPNGMLVNIYVFDKNNTSIFNTSNSLNVEYTANTDCIVYIWFRCGDNRAITPEDYISNLLIISEFANDFNTLGEKVEEVSGLIDEVTLTNYSQKFTGDTNQKTVTGDGSNTILGTSLYGFHNHYGVFDLYASAKVRVNKPCKIMLFRGNNITNDIFNSEILNSNGTQKYLNGISVINAEENKDYVIYGKKSDFEITSSSYNKSIGVYCCFENIEAQNGATLTISDMVSIDLTESFGDITPTTEAMNTLLSNNNYYFDGNITIPNGTILKMFDSIENREFGQPFIKFNDDKSVFIHGDINPNWSGWDKIQNSYGQNKNYVPIPIDIHGKVVTDSQFTSVPLYSHWGRKGVSVGAGDWGGHVFHGWNDAMTYRLTAMASGGMTSPDIDFKSREDEFCLHVFSPTNAYNNPISMTDSEANNRVTREQEDVFSGGAYYGRLRIGADKSNEGFVFRSKSLTCYGRVDLNGNKLILGNQIANVPASSNASGVKGQIAYDENYMYICVDTNKWKRTVLETW